MNDTYYLITLVRIRREGLDTEIWTNPFRIKTNCPTEDNTLLSKMRNCVRAFLHTAEGRQAAERSCYDFNWGDVVQDIPDTFWATHAIYPVISSTEPFLCIGGTALLVNQDEVLCGGEDEEGDSDSSTDLCDSCSNRIVVNSRLPIYDCAEQYTGVSKTMDDGAIVTDCEDYSKKP